MEPKIISDGGSAQGTLVWHCNLICVGTCKHIWPVIIQFWRFFVCYSCTCMHTAIQLHLQVVDIYYSQYCTLYYFILYSMALIAKWNIVLIIIFLISWHNIKYHSYITVHGFLQNWYNSVLGMINAVSVIEHSLIYFVCRVLQPPTGSPI